MCIDIWRESICIVSHARMYIRIYLDPYMYPMICSLFLLRENRHDVGSFHILSLNDDIRSKNCEAAKRIIDRLVSNELTPLDTTKKALRI